MVFKDMRLDEITKGISEQKLEGTKIGEQRMEVEEIMEMRN